LPGSGVVGPGLQAAFQLGGGPYVVKFHGDAQETANLIGYSLRDPGFRAIYNRIGPMLQIARHSAHAIHCGPAPDTWS
jgi:hypothetical protein